MNNKNGLFFYKKEYFRYSRVFGARQAENAIRVIETLIRFEDWTGNREINIPGTVSILMR
jgi:hypothetical protein